MRSRLLAVGLIALLLFIVGSSGQGLLVLAQDGSPVSEVPQAEVPPTETAVPEAPTGIPSTETATLEPTVTAEILATDVPVQPAADITLDASAATCYTGLSYWQVFVTMDGPAFPVTATLGFSNGDTPTVAYNQSSYINGRYYGYFEWYGNVSDQLVSITGAFPAELNPSVETVSGPNCGPATATATAIATSTPTSTATAIATATATSGPMVVTRNNVNCRTGGDTSFASLGVVARNTWLPVRGTEVNGWIPVICFGQDGWIISDQLNSAPLATATVPAGSTVTTTTRVNCRVGANTSSAILGVVASNTTLAMRGPSQGGWTPVICFGQEGWISSTHLNTQPTPTASAPEGTLVTTTRVNCRSSASSSSGANIITVLDSGVTVPVRGPASGGWTPVECGSQNGWISSRFLTLPESATTTATPTLIPLEGTAFLQANAHCRVGPGTSFTSLGVVGRNARIPLRGGLQHGWYPVTCFGQSGWILGNYIAVQTRTPTRTATPLPPTSTPTATATMTATATPTLIPLEGTAFLQANAHCRVGPGTSFTSLGVVGRNARIPLRGGLQNGWYPVTCFGQSGWILGNYIAVQTPTPTRTATPLPPTSTPTATATMTATATPTLIPLEGTAFLQANAHCRVGPGTSFTSLGVVGRNARIPLRGGLQNGWYPVTCFGQSGWIFGNYIAVQTPTPTS